MELGCTEREVEMSDADERASIYHLSYRGSSSRERGRIFTFIYLVVHIKGVPNPSPVILKTSFTALPARWAAI